MAGFARATTAPPTGTATATALLTGERLVVFLFAARVALEAPARLAAPLAALAAAALGVELAVDGSAHAASSSLRRFRTRPGASSGILLGATTLPSVMLSQLIQRSRLLPADPNGTEEFAYLEMQYWAASISCLSVLAFFLWHLRQSPGNGISKHLKYGSLLVALYPMTYFLSFPLKTGGGPMGMTNMVYMLWHGIAVVILIKHILEKFPSCSSFGEALLVSSGLVLYFGDMLAHTLSKMKFSMSSKAFIHTPGTRSDITTIIQGILLGLFLLPLLYKSSPGAASAAPSSAKPTLGGAASLKLSREARMAATPAPPASAHANGNGSHAGMAAQVGAPTNPMATALLTDQYQFSMAYAYWKAGKHADRAVFDLYFRKNPFGGEFTVFAGLEECIKFIANFKFTEDDVSFLQSVMPMCEGAFFDYLREVDCSDVEVYSIPEGSVVFPKVPLMRVEGPVAVVQLLETPFVNLINYASLVTTNAARHRHVAGKSKVLLEFGLRRAQGPDGAISASKYCFMGGFDATSNVLAGNLFGIPLRGTHSHAFVSSYMSLDEIPDKALRSKDGSRVCQNFVSLVQGWLQKIQAADSLGGVFGYTNQSELAAFSSYALAFPGNFLALVDTYDVMRSGIPNFCAVALALHDLGYKASGIRLDSGDLAYLSIEARKVFRAVEEEFNVPGFGKMVITASNDLNEETIDALNKQGHEVDAFGIGTYLVTCYSQAALGCVFKLVEINSRPRIKLSEDVAKVSIPCKKRCFRLYGKEGYPLVDIMIRESEPSPKAGERILCRHPFIESKRAYVVPQHVEELLQCYWPGRSDKPRAELPSLDKIRSRCMQQLEKLRPDHIRRLNPTPYKVSVSAKLYDFIHCLWLNEAPVGELQ